MFCLTGASFQPSDVFSWGSGLSVQFAKLERREKKSVSLPSPCREEASPSFCHDLYRKSFTKAVHFFLFALQWAQVPFYPGADRFTSGISSLSYKSEARALGSVRQGQGVTKLTGKDAEAAAYTFQPLYKGAQCKSSGIVRDAPRERTPVPTCVPQQGSCSMEQAARSNALTYSGLDCQKRPK